MHTMISAIHLTIMAENLSYLCMGKTYYGRSRVKPNKIAEAERPLVLHMWDVLQKNQWRCHHHDLPHDQACRVHS
jgi:hypothetical protein